MNTYLETSFLSKRILQIYNEDEFGLSKSNYGFPRNYKENKIWQFDLVTFN